jgi:hypothetical protein
VPLLEFAHVEADHQVLVVGLVRGATWAQKALFAVVGWLGLVGPAVAAMAITMYVNEDPIASGGKAIFMSVRGGLFFALAVYAFRPLLGLSVPRLISRRFSP